MFGFKKKPADVAVTVTAWDTSLDVTPPAQQTPRAVEAPAAMGYGYSGSKFAGGIVDAAENWLFSLDYWTLRRRSSELYHTNLYARGIINRLITNEINKGLTPEAHPLESVLPFDEDTLADWADDTEDRFDLWANDPQACDYKGERTFGQLQALARMEAIVGGDCLVIIRPGKRYNMPTIQVVRGDKVMTPAKVPVNAEIVDGVEYDLTTGREIAYWVDDKRINAWGPKSRRRTAFMLHGPRRRADQKRGEPLLSVVIQSLKELDRYRDNALRKSVISSLLAIFIKKDEPKPGSTPFANAALGRETVTAGNTSDGTPRTFNLSEALPGIVIDELQHGETPQAFGSDGTDMNLPAFETAIVAAMAWCLEIPPEIATLAFSNNYSASQAAINEFKMYLDFAWSEFGSVFCASVWREWLITDALAMRMPGRIGQSLLDSFRDPAQRQTFNAFCAVEFYGNVKPSTDMLKQVRGSVAAIEAGLSTATREARMIRGASYRRNMRVRKREAAALAEIQKILQPEGPANGSNSARLDHLGVTDSSDSGDDND